MTEVISKRSFTRFYLALFFINVFIGLCCLGFIAWFFELYHSNHFETRNYGLWALVAFLLACAARILYRYIKCSPSITVNKDFIKINDDTYYWTDIETIKLNETQFLTANYLRECIALKFKNGKKVVMMDYLYSNLDEIKLFIKSCIIDKADTPPPAITQVPLSEIEGQQFVFFKGVQVLSIIGFFMWLLVIAAVVFAIIWRHQPVAIFFCVIVAFSSFFGFSQRLNYIGISDEYLLIKTQNLSWRRKAYRLKDIKEIVFDQPSKGPFRFGVITNDFKISYYIAPSPWPKQRNALKQALAEKNVSVRDEWSTGK